MESAVQSGVLAAFNEQYAKRLARRRERSASGPKGDMRSAATAMARDFPTSVTPRGDH